MLAEPVLNRILAYVLLQVFVTFLTRSLRRLLTVGPSRAAGVCP